MIKVLYRLSDSGYNKVKPEYITNDNCLKNFIYEFCVSRNQEPIQFWLTCDKVSDKTYAKYEILLDYIHKEWPYIDVFIERTDYGNGAASFNHVLNRALSFNDEDIIYFVENDFLHIHNSKYVMLEAFSLNAAYVTLYVHPDKFIPPQKGGNPLVCADGGYTTNIYRGDSQLFFIVNSTTMTFASKVKTLKQDETILRKHTSGTHPNDFQMFLELGDKGRALLCPVNSYATHGETAWLAPILEVSSKDLINEWSGHCYKFIQYFPAINEKVEA